MKGSLRTMLGRVGVLKGTRMETRMWVGSGKGKRTLRGFISGWLEERNTRESSTKVLNTATVLGITSKARSTQVSGGTRDLKVSESTPGLTQINTKASGGTVSNTARARIVSLMEIDTKVSMSRASSVARGTMSGLRDLLIKVGSRMV